MKASFLFIFGQFVILFIYAIIIIGCGEDIEDQNTIPLLDSSWFTALDMPTADGDSWEYIRSDGKYQYTSKIVGTTNVGGTTARILVSNSDIPADYLGASYGFPIRNYLFTKDTREYKEYAYELWISFLHNTYFQRYIPERIAWSFPLYDKKEWVVNKLYTQPSFIYTRKVTSSNESITVPYGNYSQVFLVQETVSIEDQPTAGIISSYWLAKGIGVIKYEYFDPDSLKMVTYNLVSFSNK